MTPVAAGDYDGDGDDDLVLQAEWGQGYRVSDGERIVGRLDQ